jgi:hypothetical protein
MEMLEVNRLARVNKAVGSESGLIIPIVLRGEGSLPHAIKSKRHYYSFERFSLTAREISKNRQFDALVREIAGVIYARKRMFDGVARDITSLCDEFALPTDEDVHPWLDSIVVTRDIFPFRQTQ